MKMEVYIDVNFYWLILPFAAVVASLILLVTVIQQSRREGIPAWKNSQLDTMMLAPSKAVLREYKKASNQVKCQLLKHDDALWALEVTDGMPLEETDPSPLNFDDSALERS